MTNKMTIKTKKVKPISGKDNKKKYVIKNNNNNDNNNKNDKNDNNTYDNYLSYFGSGNIRIFGLGYNNLKLKQRLECQFKDGMSWDNYGKWHIDHKKPISKFNKCTDLKIINSLSNLQPLWAKDNLSKGNKF